MGGSLWRQNKVCLNLLDKLKKSKADELQAFLLQYELLVYLVHKCLVWQFFCLFERFLELRSTEGEFKRLTFHRGLYDSLPICTYKIYCHYTNVSTADSERIHG
jgi:hypothetical protein